jgi:hypothetical protein
MTDKPLPPPTEAAIFEAGYLAATLRARREFTWAQRAAILSVLSSAPPDPRVAEPETPRPALRVLPHRQPYGAFHEGSGQQWVKPPARRQQG